MTFARYLAVGGFKAFRDWSLLDLSPRVSVIVGRNGSGKSTLIEALLWTLGEQDLGHLRAGSAADLLFQPLSGGAHPERSEREQHLIFEYPGEGEVPADKAERAEEEGALAYLVLGDERDHDDTGGGCGCCCEAVVEQRREVPEGLITVSRSLDLDSRDSFKIDGEPATPAEVQTALSAHGLNRGVVSVIRQGELERILLAEPEMRAAMLAGAAGISLDGPEDGESLLLELESRRLRDRIRGIEEAMSRSQPMQGSPVHGPGAAEVIDLVQTTLRSWRVGEQLPGGTERVVRLLGLADVHSGVPSQERSLLHDALQEVERDLSQAISNADAREVERTQAMLEAHRRVEQRFARFLATLVPGSEAELPLDLGKGLTAAALGVRAAFPDCGYEPIEALSGGQRALVSFALGLALFVETPSRLLVLDEVEPALDDSNLRRFNSLLHEIAETRQVVVVSHQRRTKEVGDVVFGVDVTGDGASMLHFRFEPASKRLIVFGRARGNWLERTAALRDDEQDQWSGPRSTSVPSKPADKGAR